MRLEMIQSEKNNRPIEYHRPTLSKQEIESVLNCLIQDQLGSGEVVQKFERVFARSFGFQQAVAVNSLLSAYHLAYLALDLKPGERILMSALAPIQAYDAAQMIGAEIELIDVDRNSFHPSDEALRELLESKKEDELPALFVLDHTCGTPSRLDLNILKERKVKILEDFTTMLGVEKDEGYFGQSGQISICGLSERDLLTTGNGALLISNDPALVRSISDRLYGASRKPLSTAFEYNLCDFQAAMGLEQLGFLGITLSRRQKIGKKYMETLVSTPHESYFSSPELDTYHSFPVVINQTQDRVKRYFSSLQIGIKRPALQPLHHLLELPRLQFANAERIYQKAIAIPLYPNLTSNNVERISAALRSLI